MSKKLTLDLFEIIGTILFPLLLFVFIWIFLCATPDQKYSQKDHQIQTNE